MYVGVSRRDSLHALGRGDKRQQFYLFIAPFLYEIDSRLRAAARRESGIYDYTGSVMTGDLNFESGA